MNRMLNDTVFYYLLSKASEAWGWFYVDTMPLKGTQEHNWEIMILNCE